MQEVMSREQFIGFLKGNMIKYRLRAGHKQGESWDKDQIKYKRYKKWYNMALNGDYIDPIKD